VIDGAPWITDAGNYIYDVNVGVIKDPQAFDAQLHTIPGVVDTGLFCGRVSRVIVAGNGGVFELTPS
jgi:ribose 5-phosphate isomerase A